MKSIIKILGSCFVFALAFVATTSSADALTITVTDPYGYSETLVDIDSEYLMDNSISTFGYVDDGTVEDTADSTPPNPQLIINQIDGLKDYYAEYGFPKCCNYLFFDFGPNWQSITNESTGKPFPGRYIYIFYGKYNPDTDNVETGETMSGTNKDYGQASLTFNGSYTDHPDDRSLFVDSPYAFVVYDNDTEEVYCLVNKGYESDSLDGIWSVEFSGVTVVSDYNYPTYYPQLTRFNNYDEHTLTCWSGFYLNSNYNYYNTAWGDWDGTVSYDHFSDKSAWDAIQDGDIIESDSAVAQIFTKAIQGIGTVVDFVQHLPSFFESIVGVLPAPIADFILICVGIVLAVIILKLALHVVG